MSAPASGGNVLQASAGFCLWPSQTLLQISLTLRNEILRVLKPLAFASTPADSSASTAGTLPDSAAQINLGTLL